MRGLHWRGVGARLLDLPPAIGEETQGTAGGNARIKLAQTTGGGIARIDEHFFLRRQLLGIELFEVFPEHQHFAAHLQHVRVVALQTQRNRTDGPDVGGNVLPLVAIPAGQALHQPPFFIAQADSQPVKLQLTAIGHRIGPHQPRLDTLVKSAQLGFGEGIVQRQHGLRMLDGMEAQGRQGPDPPRWGIGRHQLRVTRLKRFQLPEQGVVFGIGNQRRIQHVVLETVVIQRLAQRLELGQDGGGCRVLMIGRQIGTHGRPCLTENA